MGSVRAIRSPEDKCFSYKNKKNKELFLCVRSMGVGKQMIMSKKMIKELSSSLLPFSDAVSSELPMSSLLRLSLFQVSVGIATVLLVGTLNRVMIVELGVVASLVATMVAIPILLAPLRAVLGFKSDNHKSLIGWKRMPYIGMEQCGSLGGWQLCHFR